MTRLIFQALSIHNEKTGIPGLIRSYKILYPDLFSYQDHTQDRLGYIRALYAQVQQSDR